MSVQADFADKRCLTWPKVEFVSRDDPLSEDLPFSSVREASTLSILFFLVSSMSAETEARARIRR